MKRSKSGKTPTTRSSTEATTTETARASRSLPQHVQERNRSIAEREALRLARPERPQGKSLAHANRNKSAVSSTPFGFDTFKRGGDNNIDDDDTRQYSPDDWCGPFSVAKQMIARREMARRKREEEQREQEEEERLNGDGEGGGSGNHHPLDEMLQQALHEKKRKANPSMTWKPSFKKDERGEDGKIDNLYQKRQKRLQKQKQSQSYQSQNKIPTLFQKCVDYIVDNFENVESLGGPFIDNSIRRAICEALVSKGKMNGAAFDTLAEEGIETLEIIDCTSVTTDQMVETLNLLIPAGLRALILYHAGRCFTSKAVQSIVDKSNNYSNKDDRTVVQLFALSIAGAYLLKDADVAKLISVTAPTLSSIQFKACPLIGLEFCNALSMHYSSSSSTQTACLLELVLEDIPSLSKKHLTNLASTSDALKHLKSLSLRQIDAIDDEVVDTILSSITGGNLEGIDLSLNVHLTDQSLSSIRKYNVNGQLKSLSLSGIQNLTAAGLEAFFTFDLPGLPNPPTLRTLDLSSCHFESVNETVIDLAISASALKRQPNTIMNRSNNNTMQNNDVSTMGGLVSLDVSGGSVTDRNMENLASKCHHSLKELKINFCTNISDNGLGYLVSKVEHQFNRLELWGCAQITEKFLDGHSRVEEGGLEILGVWMAKGCRSSKK